MAAAVNVFLDRSEDALTLIEMIQGFRRLMAFLEKGSRDVKTQLYMAPVVFRGRLTGDNKNLIFSFEKSQSGPFSP